MMHSEYNMAELGRQKEREMQDILSKGPFGISAPVKGVRRALGLLLINLGRNILGSESEFNRQYGRRHLVGSVRQQ